MFSLICALAMAFFDKRKKRILRTEDQISGIVISFMHMSLLPICNSCFENCNYYQKNLFDVLVNFLGMPK